ncbi:putative 7-deoxyloganetic acid glucosyltransferase [Helianthus debilis subsp. tardiflorus]
MKCHFSENSFVCENCLINQQGLIKIVLICHENEGTNMDELIVNVKGMEGFLRRRDLPSFCRSGLSNRTLQQVSSISRRALDAHAIILNTFDDLEGCWVYSGLFAGHWFGTLSSHGPVRSYFI